MNVNTLDNRKEACQFSSPWTLSKSWSREFPGCAALKIPQVEIKGEGWN